MGKATRHHLVPQCYLKGFARELPSHGGRKSRWMIERHPVIGPRKVVSIRDVALSSGRYAVTLPSGTTSLDLENQYGVIEDHASPVLRSLESAWPLTGDERQAIAELLAAQFSRSPEWFENHDANWARVAGSDGEASVGSVRAAIIQDGHARLTTIVMSMRWSLLAALSPRLITSDHPLLLRDSQGKPTTLRDPDFPGLLATLELVVPLTARHLLVCDWRDEPHDPNVRPLHAHLIANANATVGRQAIVEWFSHPDVPRMGLPAGGGRPISSQIPGGFYSWSVAMRSQRRSKVTSYVEEAMANPETSSRIMELLIS